MRGAELRLSSTKKPHNIRDETVFRPIAAADDVSVARPSQLEVSGEREHRLTVSRGHQFGAGFACAIRVLSSESTELSVTPRPFAIVVNLVGGDTDDRPYVWALPRGLQNVRRAHDIGRERLNRITMGPADKRLRSEVKHDLWLCRIHGPLDAVWNRECRG